MKKPSLLSILFIMIILLSGFIDKLNTNGKIIVEITGFKNNQGETGIYLFKSEDGFPDKPGKAIKSSRIKISNNKCQVIFDDVPFGTYAISGYHDENNDQKMNSTFYGKPTEGACASNNAKGHMGPPSFEDAKFNFSSDNYKISIKMEYF